MTYWNVSGRDMSVCRPVVGFINICPNRIDLGMQSRAFMIHLIKHEIIHTLVLLGYISILSIPDVKCCLILTLIFITLKGEGREGEICEGGEGERDIEENNSAQ